MTNVEASSPVLSRPRVLEACEATVAARARPQGFRLGLLWVIAGRSLGIVVTMLVNIAMARCLTPTEFGEFLVIASVLGFASLLAMFGMNSAVVRFVPESFGRGDVAQARQSLRLVTCGAAVCIASVGGLVAIALVCLDATIIGLSLVPELIPMLIVGLVLLATLQFLAEACRSVHELRMASMLSGGQTGGLLSNSLYLFLIAATMVMTRPGLVAAVSLNILAMAITLPIAIAGRFHRSGPIQSRHIECRVFHAEVDRTPIVGILAANAADSIAHFRNRARRSVDCRSLLFARRTGAVWSRAAFDAPSCHSIADAQLHGNCVHW